MLQALGTIYQANSFLDIYDETHLSFAERMTPTFNPWKLLPSSLADLSLLIQRWTKQEFHRWHLFIDGV